MYESRFSYKPYAPRGIIAIDVNLRAITAYDGSDVRRLKARFIDALSKKKRAEELQKKYSKRWRYSENILGRIRSLHRRARSIVVDYCRKVAKQVVLYAKRKQYGIAVEELEGLREPSSNKSDRVVWKLAMFAYRRLQHAIISKALEYDVPIIIADPRDTSSRCPRCGERLTYTHRLGVCGRCGLARDRDLVGAVNIWLRALYAYAGEPGSPLRAVSR